MFPKFGESMSLYPTPLSKNACCVSLFARKSTWELCGLNGSFIFIIGLWVIWTIQPSPYVSR